MNELENKTLMLDTIALVNAMARVDPDAYKDVMRQHDAEDYVISLTSLLVSLIESLDRDISTVLDHVAALILSRGPEVSDG